MRCKCAHSKLTSTKFVLRLSLGCINQLESTVLSSIVLEGEVVVLEIIIASLLVTGSLLLVRRIGRLDEVGVTAKLVLLVEVRIRHVSENIQLLASHRSPTIGVEMDVQILNGRFRLGQ